MEADRALRRLLALRPRDLASITSREFYDAVIRCFVELCGIRHGAFYVVSTRGGRLELKASFGLSEEWQTFSRELTIGAGPGCGTSGWAAAEKRLVISRDHSESSWDGLRQHALSAGLRSSWAIPLFDSDREVIGVFTGYDTAPGEPAAHQIQQAEHIIHEAATIIEMATLYYGQKGLLKLHRRTQ
ncbi:MAG: GAF domain-containing protein, partial [Clostridia bacterium]